MYDEMDNVKIVDSGDNVNISFVGDISLADNFEIMPYYDSRNEGIYGILSTDVVDRIKSADIMVANNEFAITNSNNKINKKNDVYVNSTKDFKNTKEILLNNGFEDNNNGCLIKRYKDKSFSYYYDSNRMMCIYKINLLTYKLFLDFSSETLEVLIVNDNNVEIENYAYNIANEKMIKCNNGSCNNYKEVMELLNKDILNLLK